VRQWPFLRAVISVAQVFSVRLHALGRPLSFILKAWPAAPSLKRTFSVILRTSIMAENCQCNPLASKTAKAEFRKDWGGNRQRDEGQCLADYPAKYARCRLRVVSPK
jgi:hypothetical protein